MLLLGVQVVEAVEVAAMALALGLLPEKLFLLKLVALFG